jgi:hypothetical protein
MKWFQPSPVTAPHRVISERYKVLKLFSWVMPPSSPLLISPNKPIPMSANTNVVMPLSMKTYSTFYSELMSTYRRSTIACRDLNTLKILVPLTILRMVMFRGM